MGGIRYCSADTAKPYYGFLLEFDATTFSLNFETNWHSNSNYLVADKYTRSLARTYITLKETTDPLKSKSSAVKSNILRLDLLGAVKEQRVVEIGTARSEIQVLTFYGTPRLVVKTDHRDYEDGYLLLKITAGGLGLLKATFV